MDNNQNQQGQQLQIDLSPEVAKGIYTNFQIISHSSSEFVLDFISMLPGIPKPTVTSRVILAPEHAKRLLAALQENIGRAGCCAPSFRRVWRLKMACFGHRLHGGFGIA